MYLINGSYPSEIIVSALLHFLSVMSRSLFLVSLPVAPTAGYGCPLPYLKSFLSSLPSQD